MNIGHYMIIGHLCFLIGAVTGYWLWWPVGSAWMALGGIMLFREDSRGPKS